MFKRAIKNLLKCACCGKWKPGHTSYHANARGFVCKRCASFLEKNPTFRNLPFKGWVWV